MKTIPVQTLILNEVESRNLLKKYNIKQNQFEFAKSKEEALDASERIGYPLVLKVVSKKIVHKSDFGGVKINLKNRKEVDEAYDEIMANAESKKVALDEIEGVTVQKMISGVEELLIGAKRDPTFGTVIVVGLGGVLVELLKDISLGITPLTEKDIIKMIKKLKGYPLLDGYRGRKSADIKDFIKMIQAVEKMMIADESILELDLNPVIIKTVNNGCLAVDARIVKKGEGIKHEI